MPTPPAEALRPRSWQAPSRPGITPGEPAPGGTAAAWEPRQKYDARTLAPLAYERTAANGSLTRLTMDGNRVRGVKRMYVAGTRMRVATGG